MGKVRFRTHFTEDEEPTPGGIGGREAAVEITAEQVGIIAGVIDDLAETVHRWNRRLSGGDEPDELLLVDAELSLVLPFVTGELPPWVEEMEVSLEIVADDEPFENPRLAREVKIDAGWERAFLVFGSWLAPIPWEELRAHFGGQDTTGDKS